MSVRILFLTGALKGGGSEKVLLDHVRALSPTYAAEILALEEDADTLDAYARLGVPVHLAGAPGPTRLLRYFLAARRLCAGGRFDLVHAWLGLPAVWGPAVVRSAGARAVVVSQRNMGHWLGPALRPAYRCSNRRFVDRIVVNAGAIASDLVGRGLAAPERIRVVRNGVEVRDLPAGPPREERRRALGLPEGAPGLAMVGTLKPLKGQEDLLRAAALLRREGLAPPLVFVGSGPDRARLEALSVELGLADRARFLGRRDDVRAVLSACDIAVLCSRVEGFPNVVLEAMEAGCCVVAARVGGVPEAVRDGIDGLLFPSGDVDALARRLQALIRDRGTLERLARSARARVEDEFGFDRMQAALEEVYVELAGGAA